MFKTSLAAAILSSAFLLSAQVNAASVTQCGPTICYTYNDAQAAVTEFGLPTFIGDSVRFLPPSFRAQSDDGALFDTATANFIFDDVYTLSGADIGYIGITEVGDYEITNGGTVSADLYLQIASNVDVFDFANTTESFDASGDSGGLQRWRLDAALLPEQEFFGDANSMSLNIQNTLQAFTDANGESAWIQKKITLTVSEVPVPAAVWLFGSGLGLLGFLRRRKLGVQ
jgi:hypothetical protein